MKNQDMHLNEDQMIRAIVDEKDLSAAKREHLSKCPICQKQKQEFEQVLNHMGEISKEMVPSSRRDLIPEIQRSHSLWGWQPALAAGFVVVLLITTIWGISLFTRFQGNGSVDIGQKIKTDQKLMTEIICRADYALPDGYLDIVGNAQNDEYEDYYDDEFLEFVLPL